MKTSATENPLSDSTGTAAPLTSGSHFGSALVSLGDFDGDGMPELAVGVPEQGPGEDYGAAWVLAPSPGISDLTAADGLCTARGSVWTMFLRAYPSGACATTCDGNAAFSCKEVFTRAPAGTRTRLEWPHPNLHSTQLPLPRPTS